MPKRKLVPENKCIECGKTMPRTVHTIRVPHYEVNSATFIDDYLKGTQYEGLTWIYFDDPATVVEKREIARARFEGAAQHRPGLDPAQYPFEVKIWFPGEYGRDGRGLFHSGKCAQEWAYKMAGDMRAKGRI